MDDENKARELAQNWANDNSDFKDMEIHLSEYGGYWWASFRPQGAERPNIGGNVLLIDINKGQVKPVSSSISPDQTISEYKS